MKITKNDKKLISDLSKTKTVRELARVYLNYLTVEEMAKFISTYLLFKNRGEEEETLNYFLKDQFLPLLKSTLLGLTDLIPDLVTDKDFMKLYSRLNKKVIKEKKPKKHS